MKKSLLNPNQCRSFGIKLCDDPTDPYRSLAILEDPVSTTVIPLNMNGSIAGFITFCPSLRDIESFAHVTLSSDMDWNPHDAVFPQQQQSKKEEDGVSYRKILLS